MPFSLSFARTKASIPDALVPLGKGAFPGAWKAQWHDFTRIGAEQSFDQFTVGGFSWQQDFGVQKAFLRVESQISFALGLVRTMAGQTVFGQQGANIPTEVGSRSTS
jgi:hypothetical protein